jgi:hypothetical protein
MLRSVLSVTAVLMVGFLVASAARNQLTNAIQAGVPALVAALYYGGNVTAPALATDPRSVNAQNVLISVVTCIPLLASASNAPILYAIR